MIDIIYAHCSFLAFLMFLQVDTFRLLGRDPKNWLRFMLEQEYPTIAEFDFEHEAIVRPFHQRYPDAPLPFVGLADFFNFQRCGLAGADYAYCGSLFDTQDCWRSASSSAGSGKAIETTLSTG